jgi:hypothetical protein
VVEVVPVLLVEMVFPGLCVAPAALEYNLLSQEQQLIMLVAVAQGFKHRNLEVQAAPAAAAVGQEITLRQAGQTVAEMDLQLLEEMVEQIRVVVVVA